MIRMVLFAFTTLIFTSPVAAEPFDVLATSIPLNASAPGDSRVGTLLYKGGLVLSSPDGRFGGWSAISVAADGQSLIAVSDKGLAMQLALTHDDVGRLLGVAGAHAFALRDDAGDALKGKKHTDAESLALATDGRFFIGFERRHRIEAYDHLDGPARPLSLPAQFPLMPDNSGVEGLTFLDDGRLLALSEGFRSNDGMIGWLGTPTANGPWDWQTLTYPSDGHSVPTGAATLPGGDVLVLERRYSVITGAGMRLRRIPREQMVAGALLSGPVLVDMTEPYAVDNFEAVDVYRTPQGAVRIMILSDDNFSPLQRTLLLEFELIE